MYIPTHFRIDDEELIYDFIEQYGFAILFSQHKGGPYATHLPLILNKSENALYGHFARPNEQWKDSKDQQVLAVSKVLTVIFHLLGTKQLKQSLHGIMSLSIYTES